MPDDEFDRDLARRLRAYESHMPEADAPRVGAGPQQSFRRPWAVAGVAAAVAAGGLAAVILLNLPWGNVGDQTPIPSPTATPEGIVQLSLDDPRRDCIGNDQQVLAVYRIPDGEAFWTLFPNAGLAPELIDIRSPLLVVVYDGIYPGAIVGQLLPSGEPIPSPRVAPAGGTVDICVETVDGSGNPAPYGVYTDIPLAESLVAAIASGSPEPTSTATPPPVPELMASNGTVGVPVSWCWDDACVDGSLDFEDLDRYPGVGDFIILESDAATTSLEATAYASAGDALQLEVRDNEILVYAPESRIVLVHAVFEGGGEVSYAWRVARQIIVSMGDDHVAIVEPLVEVTPLHAPGDATVRLTYTNWELLGVEGAAMFLKATDPRGTVILDRIVSPENGEERLPPGDYELTAYYRACDGSCGVLDPPESFCSVDAMLGPSESLQLVISVSQRSCEATRGD